jgi:hypothetical protein
MSQFSDFAGERAHKTNEGSAEWLTLRSFQHSRCERSVAARVIDFGESEELQDSDVHPADIELEPAGRKAR